MGYCADRGWYGVENLSLIPGEVGASAVQNIGAYGVEVKDLISFVETVNIQGVKHVTKRMNVIIHTGAVFLNGRK